MDKKNNIQICVAVMNATVGHKFIYMPQIYDLRWLHPPVPRANLPMKGNNECMKKKANIVHTNQQRWKKAASSSIPLVVDFRKHSSTTINQPA